MDVTYVKANGKHPNAVASGHVWFFGNGLPEKKGTVIKRWKYMPITLQLKMAPAKSTASDGLRNRDNCFF
jgi:hypothetical protein